MQDVKDLAQDYPYRKILQQEMNTLLLGFHQNQIQYFHQNLFRKQENLFGACYNTSFHRKLRFLARLEKLQGRNCSVQFLRIQRIQSCILLYRHGLFEELH